MTDGLSQAYAELLDGSYDSLDRIVLSGYFRFTQSPADVRVWWRQLHGSDEDLDNATPLPLRSTICCGRRGAKRLRKAGRFFGSRKLSFDTLFFLA
jgi:hypothetical protein